MSSFVLDETAVQNIKNVRKMIDRKVGILGQQNFYVKENEIKGVFSDVDQMPYTRLYRGDPFTNEAVTWSGDSGFKPRMNGFYKPLVEGPMSNSDPLCFQTPCSTVYPCYPQYLQKGQDKASELLQDRYCVKRYI
jgi:hypothetical protein